MKHLFRKGEIANPNGRPKGARNKYSKLRDDILSVFQKIGGVQSMVTWARNPLNRKDFYRIAVDLLPKDIKLGFGDDDVVSAITVEFINGNQKVKNKISKGI
ncbi:MAG TPA: hypothetical protein DCE80_14335 [Ignavibacteriales bacterium]|nr:hypothetical protein [Ignavibacteriales bacterium]